MNTNVNFTPLSSALDCFLPLYNLCMKFLRLKGEITKLEITIKLTFFGEKLLWASTQGKTLMKNSTTGLPLLLDHHPYMSYHIWPTPEGFHACSFPVPLNASQSLNCAHEWICKWCRGFYTILRSREFFTLLRSSHGIYIFHKKTATVQLKEK